MLYFVALNLRFHSHNVAEHENSCFESSNIVSFNSLVVAFLFWMGLSKEFEISTVPNLQFITEMQPKFEKSLVFIFYITSV